MFVKYFKEKYLMSYLITFFFLRTFNQIILYLCKHKLSSFAIKSEYIFYNVLIMTVTFKF